uniref:Pleiomorphic adenoma gene-like 2 n=1 Tax=Neogobius melanostomus TaxID=47308 RepID=A0A8C6UD84_9GOBI
VYTGIEREREREGGAEVGRASGSECLVCGALFSSQDKLRLHALSHSGDKPFHCSQPHCPKAFSSKYKLFRHMATHSPQKSHQCTFCEKMFHRKDHLKNHLQTHDPNKEAFKCDECGKHYNTKLGYKRHVAMHSATSGDLTCKVCLQSYESTPVLLEHLKSHSGKSSGGAKEKKHPCDHCDRRFYTRKDVRRHMVVHTGRKDFLCQYCAQRFGRKDHLTRHVKKSHSQELLKIKSEPPDMLGLLASGSPPCTVKEELSPMMCAMGPNKDPLMGKPFPSSLCAANMDFSHLLGFLPLNLPPYSAPMSSGGLVMGYTSAPSSSCSSSSSLLAAEPHAAPLTSVQPQPQEPAGALPLPPVFSSGLSSTTLPRFHQAFQ